MFPPEWLDCRNLLGYFLRIFEPETVQYLISSATYIRMPTVPLVQVLSRLVKKPFLLRCSSMCFLHAQSSLHFIESMSDIDNCRFLRSFSTGLECSVNSVNVHISAARLTDRSMGSKCWARGPFRPVKTVSPGQ